MRMNIKKIAILSLIEDTKNPKYKVYTFVEKLGKGKQMVTFVGQENEELKQYIGKILELDVELTTKEEVFELKDGSRKFVETVSYFLQSAKPYQSSSKKG